MPARYFTIEEVNSILPELEHDLGDLMERRDRAATVGREMRHLFGRNVSDVGGKEASQLVQEFAIIEQLIERIKGYGCEIKDLNGGLVDFLAKRNGREVYLCWRYGEAPEIRYYHELHAGFQGRQEIDPADFEE